MSRFSRHQAAAIAQAGARKRQLTITNLIANVRAETGRTPTDAELAGLLATSVSKIRRHRAAIKGKGPC